MSREKSMDSAASTVPNAIAITAAASEVQQNARRRRMVHRMIGLTTPTF
jgi:hypothetical protein